MKLILHISAMKGKYIFKIMQLKETTLIVDEYQRKNHYKIIIIMKLILHISAMKGKYIFKIMQLKETTLIVER